MPFLTIDVPNRLLGWRPRKEFVPALTELAEWYRPGTTPTRRAELIRAAVDEAVAGLAALRSAHPAVPGPHCPLNGTAVSPASP